MRLPEPEIVAGLQHPSLFVRECVAEYLADCNRTQADVTRQLIAAIEQFGWSEALEFPHRVASFEVDEFSLPWLLAEIERRDERAPTENLRWHFGGNAGACPDHDRQAAPSRGLGDRGDASRSNEVPGKSNEC